MCIRDLTLIQLQRTPLPPQLSQDESCIKGFNWLRSEDQTVVLKPGAVGQTSLCEPSPSCCCILCRFRRRRQPPAGLLCLPCQRGNQQTMRHETAGIVCQIIIHNHPIMSNKQVCASMETAASFALTSQCKQLCLLESNW